MTDTAASETTPTETTPTDIDDLVLRRVRSLLAKAEATSFVEEAAIFTAKAHEVMATHAIDRAMVDARRGETTVTSVRIVLPAPYARDKYRLLGAVASPNRCRAILGIEGSVLDPELSYDLIAGRRVATVFGYRSDLDVVELLFTSLLLQATNVMVGKGSVVDECGQNRTRAFRHSFLVGFAWTIGDRLHENQRQTTGRADHDAHGSVLPVLADRSTRVDSAVDAAFPRLGTLTTSLSSHIGLAAGENAGRRADIGTTRLGGDRRRLPGPNAG